MLSCGKTNESKANEFSMSFEVELTTTATEAEHVERGAEVDATGVGRSEVRFANLYFSSNCARLPSPTETGLTRSRRPVRAINRVSVLGAGSDERMEHFRGFHLLLRPPVGAGCGTWSWKQSRALLTTDL